MNKLYGGVYIPNLANYAEQYGIGQYRFAHNYELAGKELVIDAEGKEYTLSFSCRKEAVFNGKKCEWEAEKLSAALYFVRFGSNCGAFCLYGGKAVLCLKGRKTPICGTLRGYEDAQAPESAGGDMVGTKVRWIFGVNRYVNHDHYAKTKLRAAWSRNTVNTGSGKTFRDGWEALPEDYNVEEVKAVKVGGPFYLVDISAKVPEGVCAPAGMNRLVLLEDYDHMLTVGCAFGADMEPIMMAGYAKFLD